jgi:hypothetical protein
MIVVLLKATWEVAGKSESARDEVEAYLRWYVARQAKDVPDAAVIRLLQAREPSGPRKEFLGAINYMKSDAAFRLAALTGMFRVVVAGESVTPDSRGWLQAVAQETGTPETDLVRLVVRFIRLDVTEAEKQAFADLGLPPSASEADIRSRFNDLAKEFHPDRHMALPPAMRDLAKREFDKLKQAYDRLMGSRVLWGRKRSVAELAKVTPGEELECFYCESTHVALPSGPAMLLARCCNCRSLLVYTHDIAQAVLREVPEREYASSPVSQEEQRQPTPPPEQPQPHQPSRSEGKRDAVNWTALAWTAVFSAGSAFMLLTVDTPRKPPPQPLPAPTVPQGPINKESIAVRTNMSQGIVTSASPIGPPIWAPPPRPVRSFSTKGVDEVKQTIKRHIAKTEFAEAIKEVNEWAESNTHLARLRPAEWESILLAKRDVWSNAEREYSRMQGGNGLWYVRAIRMQAQVYEDLMQHCADVNGSADKTRDYYLLAVLKAQSALDTSKHLRDATERNNERRLAYHQRGLAKHRYGKHTRNIFLLDEAMADYQKATGLFTPAEGREPDAVAVYGSLSDAKRDRNDLIARREVPTGLPPKRYPPRPGLVRPDRGIR